jgi:5-methylcytosine-specific restriction enzyme subunit McrC
VIPAAVPLVAVTEGDDWQDKILAPGQITAIRACGLVDIEEKPGRCRVRSKRPQGYAGIIRVGGGADTVDVRVQPKIPISRLLFLAGYASKIEDLRWHDEEIDVGTADEVLPAVAYAFGRAADRALRTGPLMGYRETEDTSFVVRGRIREADQVRRHYSFPLPAEIRFDDYTADIPENQLLLASARRLLKLPGIPPVTQAMLRRLFVRLSTVSSLAPGHPLPHWRPSRLNVRYQTALGLAEVVLRGDSYELDDGTAVKADGLMMLMWKLFEDFVTKALTDELRAHDGRCESQDTAHFLDTGSLFQLKPDLVYYRRNAEGREAPFAAIDAKYKMNGRPDRGDMYQLVAYCVALGLRNGYLISAGSTAMQRPHQITRSGITIIEHVLDLDKPPDSIRRQIRELAADILIR